MSFKIYNDDIIDWSKKYKGEKFHAMFTDCPYEYGFMGKSWDDSGISFQSETWSALSEHLYPGAFCLTYGGARTHHRIAVAIEDAGFRIHPTIFAWAYSSGFPKSTRIDTQIDKAAGANREVVGKMQNPASEIFRSGKMDRSVDVTRPATELAQAWEGHRYGLQALKPAVEPLILFQKPYDLKTKPFESISKHGAGALWIEGTRVGDRTISQHGYPGEDLMGAMKGSGVKGSPDYHQTEGLWPSNFVLYHHPLCIKGNCYGTCNVAALGNNSEYFASFDWTYNLIERSSVRYDSKSSTKERAAALSLPGEVGHPTMKPISANIYFAQLLLPPQMYRPRRLLIPFAGVMSELIGGMLAGWEYVCGVELSETYAKAGYNRAMWWHEMSKVYGTDIKSILNAYTDESPMQLRMELK